MRRLLQAVVLVALAPNAFAKAPGKLITVVTDGWTATTGELRRWERDGKSWRAVGEPVPVVVGKSGLKWPADKREGDGASPAGRFALGEATGYDAPPPGVRLRYRVASDELHCVDDPKSPRYNQLAPLPVGEPMRRSDELYRFTIFVRYNDKRAPNLGSCIFLHVWNDAHSPTVGCTAMALERMRDLLIWADPDTQLVQLPRAEYDARQRAWGLPQRK
jgi:D-alanyl-D-alanine dipeptidase